MNKKSSKQTKSKGIPWKRYGILLLLLVVVAIVARFVLKQNGEVTVSEIVAQQTETQLLDDKSKVTLREGAKLRYPSKFIGDKREVGLFGEAYFDVAKKRKPFTVNIEHGTIEAVGTKFNVRTHFQNLCTIKVKEGKVRFTSKSGEVKEVKSGEALIFYYQNNQSFIVPMAPINMDSWVSNILTFDEVPLQSVVVDLNEHFGANIQIELDELKNCLYTSTFQNKELDHILESLRNTFQLDGIDQFDTIVALRGGTCPRK